MDEQTTKRIRESRNSLFLEHCKQHSDALDAAKSALQDVSVQLSNASQSLALPCFDGRSPGARDGIRGHFSTLRAVRDTLDQQLRVLRLTMDAWDYSDRVAAQELWCPQGEIRGELRHLTGKGMGPVPKTLFSDRLNAF